MAFECVTWTNKETAMNNAKKTFFYNSFEIISQVLFPGTLTI